MQGVGGKKGWGLFPKDLPLVVPAAIVEFLRLQFPTAAHDLVDVGILATGLDGPFL